MHSKITILTTSVVIIALLMQDFLVSAVNSPQMTFFTPPSHKSTIHLESKYGYSATLKLSRSRAHMTLPSSRFGRSHNNATAFTEKSQEKKLTEYTVLGPDYPFHGVTAVIQEMNLRTTTNGCRDFVQFAQNATTFTKSPEICGYISRDDMWINGTGGDSRLQRSFFNPEGVIHIYYYSDPSDEDEAEDIRTSQGETRDLGIEIVFTSYTVCPNPANSWKKLKACSSTDQMSCIYSTLFCDSKVDCGFPGEYGIDEEGCYYPYIYMTVSIVSGILITSTLIYLFVRWVTKVPKEYR